VTCAAANWIFSRVRTRQRREKQTAGHNLLHNLIKIIMAFMVLPVSPNLQVGAQQKLRENCIAKLIMQKNSIRTNTAKTARSRTQSTAIA